MSHTKGPWTYSVGKEEAFVHARIDDWHLVTIAAMHDHILADVTLITTEERDANARLVSAAPDLYEAALLAISSAPMVETSNPLFLSAMSALVKALNKAKGTK